MDQKARILELIENASKIGTWLDPLSKDKARLTIIQELINLWDFENSQRLMQELYFEKSIQFAESMISWVGSIPNIEDSSYLRVIEKQSNKKIIMPKSLKYTKERKEWDYLVYDSMLKYLEENKNSLTPQKKSYVTKNIGRMKDEAMKIKLENLLWKWDWIKQSSNFRYKKFEKLKEPWNLHVNILTRNEDLKNQELINNFSDFVKKNNGKSFFRKPKSKNNKKKQSL